MNKQRRKILCGAITSLEEIKSTIDNIRDEETDAFDNMPENLQDSDRGSQMQENIDNLDEAYESIEELIDKLNDVLES